MRGADIYISFHPTAKTGTRRRFHALATDLSIAHRLPRPSCPTLLWVSGLEGYSLPANGDTCARPAPSLIWNRLNWKVHQLEAGPLPHASSAGLAPPQRRLSVLAPSLAPPNHHRYHPWWVKLPHFLSFFLSFLSPGLQLAQAAAGNSEGEAERPFFKGGPLINRGGGYAAPAADRYKVRLPRRGKESSILPPGDSFRAEE